MEKEMSGEYKQFKVFFLYASAGKDIKKEELICSELNHLAKAFYDFTDKTFGFEVDKYEYILNVNLVGDKEIRDINKQYRKKDKITDVLSFPLQENLRGGKYDNFLEELELGDLFICDSVCEKQAQEFSISYIEEFLHLSVHGFLHLCGYDHEVSEAEEKIMEAFEESILLDIKKARS